MINGRPLSLLMFSARRFDLKKEKTDNILNGHILMQRIIAQQSLLKTSYLTTYLFWTGNYRCQISQVNTLDLHHIISSLDTYIQLRAIVPAQEHQPEISSGIISLPFLPAFYIHTSEVHVSNLLPLTSVRVSAVDRVIQDLKVHFWYVIWLIKIEAHPSWFFNVTNTSNRSPPVWVGRDGWYQKKLVTWCCLHRVKRMILKGSSLFKKISKSHTKCDQYNTPESYV